MHESIAAQRRSAAAASSSRPPGQHLVLDIGLPLAAALGEESPLPLIRGIAGRDPSLVGVVLSHAHPDHYAADRFKR